MSRIAPPTIERLPQVLARTGLKKTALYDLMASGKFPRSVRLTDRTCGWDSHAVDNWIRNIVAAANH